MQWLLLLLYNFWFFFLFRSTIFYCCCRCCSAVLCFTDGILCLFPHFLFFHSSVHHLPCHENEYVNNQSMHSYIDMSVIYEVLYTEVELYTVIVSCSFLFLRCDFRLTQSPFRWTDNVVYTSFSLWSISRSNEFIVE